MPRSIAAVPPVPPAAVASSRPHLPRAALRCSQAPRWPWGVTSRTCPMRQARSAYAAARQLPPLPRPANAQGPNPPICAAFLLLDYASGHGCPPFFPCPLAGPFSFRRHFCPASSPALQPPSSFSVPPMHPTFTPVIPVQCCRICILCTCFQPSATNPVPLYTSPWNAPMPVLFTSSVRFPTTVCISCGKVIHAPAPLLCLPAFSKKALNFTCCFRASPCILRGSASNACRLENRHWAVRSACTQSCHPAHNAPLGLVSIIQQVDHALLFLRPRPLHAFVAILCRLCSLAFACGVVERAVGGRLEGLMG